MNKLLLIVALLLSHSFLLVSQNADLILNSAELQEALKKADWEEVLNIIPDDTTAVKDSKITLLCGHAYYALQAYNLAATAFHLTTDSLDLLSWEKWTNGLFQRDAGQSVFQFLAADGLARNKKYDQALQLLNDASKDENIAHLVHVAKGVIFDILSNEEEAENSFMDSKRADSNFLDTKLCLGVMDLERNSTYSPFFKQVLEKDPSIALAYNGEACRRAMLHERKVPVELIIRAHEMLPTNPYIISNARALNDSTNTTLDSIANLKMQSRGFAYVGKAFTSLAPDNIKFNYSQTKGLGVALDWKLSNAKNLANSFYDGIISDPNSNWAKRGGIFFQFGTFKGVSKTPQKIGTEFTLGYPRISINK